MRKREVPLSSSAGVGQGHPWSLGMSPRQNESSGGDALKTRNGMISGGEDSENIIEMAQRTTKTEVKSMQVDFAVKPPPSTS